MRRPVNEPGPTETANRSMSCTDLWLHSSSACAIGMMVWLWVSRASV